jgi:hypothetical protein
MKRLAPFPNQIKIQTCCEHSSSEHGDSLTIDFRYDIPKSWTKDGSEFKRNNKASVVDLAWLNLIYPPPKQKQFVQALSNCGISISEESRELILKLYSDTRLTNPSSSGSIMV